MLLVRNRKNIRITWCRGYFRRRYVDASVCGFRMKESFLRIQLGTVTCLEIRGGICHALIGQWLVDAAGKRLFGMSGA